MSELFPAQSGMAPLSALSLQFTWFAASDQPSGERSSISWVALCEWIEHQSPIAEAKDKLPLIKLATFAGNYRSDANTEAVFGIEGDYDGEAVPPELAASILSGAGVEALIVTSPSHRPLAPRWRVLAPLSRAHQPADRHTLIGRLNGALGGILALESFTLSQAFYVGSVSGGEPLRCWRITGRPIDIVPNLATIGPSRSHDDSRKQPLGSQGLVPSYDVALAALRSRDPYSFKSDRNGWLAFSGAFRSATHGLPGSENAEADWLAWNRDSNVITFDAANDHKTWRDYQRNGTHHGADYLRSNADLRKMPDDLVGKWLFEPAKSYIDTWMAANMPKPQAADGFFVLASDLQYRRPEFHIDKLLETQSMALIFGDPGAGKSFVAIDMACCIATGAPFHEHAVKQGSVFYIAGEGHNGLKRRLTAWEQHNGVSLEGAKLYVSRASAQFLDAQSAQMVSTAVNALATTHGAPRLIIVDTLARNFGPGDENSQKDMNLFVARLDQLKALYRDCSILIVHHSGHGDKERSRGSSVLKGAVDCEYKVENKDGAVTLDNTKMKDASPPPAMSFELVTVGYSAALQYIGERGKAGAVQALTPSAQTAMDAFTQCNKASVNVEEWRAAFYAKRDGSPDAKKRAFQRARDELISRGQLTASEDGTAFRLPPMPGMTITPFDKSDLTVH